MKRSLISVAVMAMAGMMTAGLAHADTTAAPAPNRTTRYDIQCSFGQPGLSCEGSARIFLDRDRSQAGDTPSWYGNLLAVSCQKVTSPPSVPSLISASDATLYRVTGSHSVYWEIFNADSSLDIDLLDRHPFGNSPSTVPAALEFDHAHLKGSCLLTPSH